MLPDSVPIDATGSWGKDWNPLDMAVPITADKGEDNSKARGWARGEERAVNSSTAFAPREAMMRGLTSTSEKFGNKLKIQTITTIETQHPKKVDRADRGSGIGCWVWSGRR